jgi:NADPH-dependent 2,4-dienoyl-CoA reductase/sulfur reductase-like enzyme
MPERLVIVGGDAAGMSAAAQARRRASVDELEIVAFERGEFTSYSACGLPYFVADDDMETQTLISRSPEEHRQRGLDVSLWHDVIGIDLDARTVTARDLVDERDVTEAFDQLVIATGATPIRPDLPGVDARGVHGIQNLTDGIELRDHLDDHREHRAVVVGGGYIGLEMAEAMHRRGLKVTIVERDPQPMSTLDPEMGALVAKAIRGIGIELRDNTDVEGFETDAEGHVRAVATSAGMIEADIVVLGIGVKPNSALAGAAGIEIGARGGVVTDQRMATSADGVWAAGDCVEVFHRVTRRPVAIALGTHANKQGRVIGVNVTGGYATFRGVIGTAVTKVCEYEIARTGLNEREAGDAAFAFVTATIESTTRAGYFPGSSPITVKMLAEQRTGRIIGAQVIGREGAAKRIDVMAAAIWNEMTVDEFAQLDLAYAPPFSPVWDPTLIAARAAADKVKR